MFMLQGDLKTSFSQPASPAKSKLEQAAAGVGMMKAQSLGDNLNRDHLARSLVSHAASSHLQQAQVRAGGGWDLSLQNLASHWKGASQWQTLICTPTVEL
jgi:hypothetical protein